MRDDCIVQSKSKTALSQFIITLTFGPDKFNFTDEGTLSKYLGVEIEQLPSQKGFKMSQLFLMQRIVDAIDMDVGAKSPVRFICKPLATRRVTCFGAVKASQLSANTPPSGA